MLVTGVSKKGGRPVNEDAYGELRIGDILCAVIADGLGGHNGGQLASKMAVDTILAEFKAAPEFSRGAVTELIRAAELEIEKKAKSDPELVHMSTTVVVLLVKGRHAVWAHVGDSRLYWFEERKIIEVTDDHSLAFMDFLEGKIEYDDIRRSENQNKLTQALGPAFKEAETHEIVNLASDASFLLCTDGWWEYVTEEQMESILEKAKNTRSWIDAMLEIREAAAPENSDNYTAVAVMI